MMILSHKNYNYVFLNKITELDFNFSDVIVSKYTPRYFLNSTFQFFDPSLFFTLPYFFLGYYYGNILPWNRVKQGTSYQY